MKVDLHYWANQYEKDYVRDTRDSYPVYVVDKSGLKREDKSPLFDTISKVLQKRGFLQKSEFVSIALWKTRRQRMRYESNSESRVKNITRQAISATGDEEKVKILDQLDGVGVPIASAILTAIYPDKYCVIDYRAWRAAKWITGEFGLSSYQEYARFLDSFRNYASLNSYLDFLKNVREIAIKYNMTPRRVEMALWKFDQSRAEKQA